MRRKPLYLSATNALVGLVSGFLIIGLPLFLSEQGLMVERIGKLFGISMLVYAFLVFYVGAGSDVRGRRLSGLIAICLMALASVLFGLIPFFSVLVGSLIFVIARILYDMSESIHRTLLKIRLLDVLGGHRLGLVFGVYILAGGGGEALGMLFGSLLLFTFDIQPLFFILPFILAVSCILYSFSGDIRETHKPFKIFDVSHLWHTSRAFKVVLLLNTMLIFSALVFEMFGLPLYQKEVLAMDIRYIFMVIGAAWLLTSIASYGGGKLFDRYGYRIFMLALFLIAITSVIMAHVKSPLVFSVVLLLDFLLYAIEDPARFSLSGKHALSQKGLLMSLFEFFAIIAGAIVLLMFGTLVDIAGFTFIFYLRAAIHVLAIGVVLYLVRVERTPG